MQTRTRVHDQNKRIKIKPYIDDTPNKKGAVLERKSESQIQ